MLTTQSGKEDLKDLHARLDGNMPEVIAELATKQSGRALAAKLCEVFGGFSGLDFDKVATYGDFLLDKDPPLKVDIVAAEKSIGIEGAMLLWKKFGITRFGRYHPTILKHQVDMASNSNHDRDKPLIMAVVAKGDYNVFYWGRRFKYDPRVRLVVLEVGNSEVTKRLMWDVRNEYGIPDIVMFTNHGSERSILLGDASDLGNFRVGDKQDLIKTFSNFFGGKKGLVIVNACYTGAELDDGGENFAQVMAEAFNAETPAARSAEGLLRLDLSFDENGKPRLTPLFFEAGRGDWFGFNFGGMVFKPHEKPVYKRAANENTGWQFGLGLAAYGSDPSADGTFGFSEALSKRLRLRGDLSLEAMPFNDEYVLGAEPEVAFGLTNHIMLAAGGIAGGVYGKDCLEPFFRVGPSLKITLPIIDSELDFGVVTPADELDPVASVKFQTRF